MSVFICTIVDMTMTMTMKTKLSTDLGPFIDLCPGFKVFWHMVSDSKWMVPICLEVDDDV